MFLYADNTKLFSTDNTDPLLNLTSANSWMNSYQLSLGSANVSIYLLFTNHHPDAHNASNGIASEIKRFLVGLHCVMWALLFLVVLNGANMLVALSLQLLFIAPNFTLFQSQQCLNSAQSIYLVA